MSVRKDLEKELAARESGVFVDKARFPLPAQVSFHGIAPDPLLKVIRIGTAKWIRLREGAMGHGSIQLVGFARLRPDPPIVRVCGRRPWACHSSVTERPAEKRADGGIGA